MRVLLLGARDLVDARIVWGVLEAVDRASPISGLAWVDEPGAGDLAGAWAATRPRVEPRPLPLPDLEEGRHEARTWAVTAVLAWADAVVALPGQGCDGALCEAEAAGLPVLVLRGRLRRSGGVEVWSDSPPPEMRPATLSADPGATRRGASLGRETHRLACALAAAADLWGERGARRVLASLPRPAGAALIDRARRRCWTITGPGAVDLAAGSVSERARMRGSGPSRSNA